MDLSYGAEHGRFRARVRTFLVQNWDIGRAEDREYVAQFRRAATSAGLLYRTVPAEYGGAGQEPDAMRAQVVREEFGQARAPREVGGVGTALLVPTLLRWGTPEQKRRFVPPTVAGELRWCQGYSEPDAGSDLESLRTTAVADGGEWVVSGQKVWTSDAARADWMFLLARTELNQPRRAGLSYLLLEMRKPGVEVRPLRQITGSSEFNEVFLTGARTPLDLLVGGRGQGWAVSRTTLAAERTTLAAPDTSAALYASLVKLARRADAGGGRGLSDPGVRSELMRLRGWIEAQRYSAMIQASRDFSATATAASGTDANDILQLLNKLVHTEVAMRVSRIALDLLGPASYLDPSLSPRPGNERWLNQFFGSLGVAIAGGTSNIQRNIVAERGLGLPRDEAVSP
ncbi:MAG TPA: acyl-CoA dehydrogenase family protein [Trebonia sp.]|jgi:alkylation response protein AidB-like acyl-CoA dehydrogenase|nr:acyl-CoA dehydrogenase family protein [Trebonia sp.]